MSFAKWLRCLSEWLHPKKLDDPEFGAITFRPGIYGVWESEPEFKDYHVRIFAPESGPTHFQRSLFREFNERRVAIEKEVEKPLADEYMSIRELAMRDEFYSEAGASPLDLDYPPINRPHEIWTIAHLIGIEINDESHQVHLGLTYDIDWADPEHNMSVYLRDWKVLDVGKEG